jgi:hypothetical protein
MQIAFALKVSVRKRALALDFSRDDLVAFSVARQSL